MNTLSNIESALIDFAPASAMVSGKTLVDRKLSIVGQATETTLAFMAGQKGKIGNAVRAGFADMAVSKMAKQCRSGDYRSLAQAIAGLTGESLTISNRAAYETLADRFNDKLADLSLSKNGGYTMSKDGTSKPSAKRNQYNQIVALIKEVQAQASAM